MKTEKSIREQLQTVVMNRALGLIQSSSDTALLKLREPLYI